MFQIEATLLSIDFFRDFIAVSDYMIEFAVHFRGLSEMGIFQIDIPRTTSEICSLNRNI